MEKDRKFRALAIAAICVAVVGVSVAYAALATTLTVSGTATVNTTNSWRVRWESTETDDVAPAITSKSNSVTFTTAPTLAADETTKLTWAATFTAPGDTFTITAFITNDGTLNAKLSNGTDLAISGDLAEHFTYSMKINSKDIDEQNGNILAAGKRVPVVITVALNDVDNDTWAEIGEAANKTVTFTATIPFVQATDEDTTEL